MALTFDVNKAIELFLSTPDKSLVALYDKKTLTIRFIDSLRLVLNKIQTDNRLTDLREVAYLLGTAHKESSYSLQRWESDYLCVEIGVPYTTLPKGQPCQRALDYYRKVIGKKVNYYTMPGGVDPKTGLPYFGRGLIQLSLRGNYETYGEKIGVNLIENADLALEENNSYNIAIEYMINRKTFVYVKNGDLVKARKSVGNTADVPEINRVYNLWLSILNQLNVSTITPTIIIVNSETNQPIQEAKIELILKEEKIENLPLLKPGLLEMPPNTLKLEKLENLPLLKPGLL